MITVGRRNLAVGLVAISQYIYRSPDNTIYLTHQ